MNLRQKVGIILVAFSVVLYFVGYFFLVMHAPNPFTNTSNFLNNMLLAFFLLLIGVIIMGIGATLLTGGDD
jgi:predicted membrane channel-forming protein YqfA (hemolysin III family)